MVRVISRLRYPNMDLNNSPVFAFYGEEWAGSDTQSYQHVRKTAWKAWFGCQTQGTDEDV